MKLNFNLKGKRRKEREYELVKTSLPDARRALYQALITAALNGVDQAAIRLLIRQNDKDFVIRLADWLDEQPGLRPLSILLAAELNALYRQDAAAGKLAERILRHAAEVPLFLHYFQLPDGAGNGKLRSRPGKPLEKALGAVFQRLDEYTYTRYDKETQAAVKAALRDLRPGAKDRAQRLFFSRILREDLPARNSWEAEWAEWQAQSWDSAESRQAALRDKWKEWISSFRPGYASLLENLPAILRAGVSGKVLKLAAEYLGNSTLVAHSGQTPFRLLEVWRTLQEMEYGGKDMLMEALEQAAQHSAARLKGFEKDRPVVIAMDVSNSMKRPVKENSRLQRFDIAPLLAILLQNADRPVLAGILGNTWKWSGWQNRRALAAVQEFHSREGEAGYATNGYLVIRDLLNRGLVADQVMIFTDSALWSSRPYNQDAESDLQRQWRKYRQLAPEARLILFDLSGSGKVRLEFPEENVLLVSGWNERLFEMLPMLEKGREFTEQIQTKDPVN